MRLYAAVLAAYSKPAAFNLFAVSAAVRTAAAEGEDARQAALAAVVDAGYAVGDQPKVHLDSVTNPTVALVGPSSAAWVPFHQQITELRAEIKDLERRTARTCDLEREIAQANDYALGDVSTVSVLRVLGQRLVPSKAATRSAKEMARLVQNRLLRYSPATRAETIALSKKAILEVTCNAARQRRNATVHPETDPGRLLDICLKLHRGEPFVARTEPGKAGRRLGLLFFGLGPKLSRKLMRERKDAGEVPEWQWRELAPLFEQ